MTNGLDNAKRVMITGGMGFIGSHLARAMLDKGHQVTVIDNLSTGRFENIKDLRDNPRFDFVIDSVTNDVVLDRLASQCDLIFHLAAAVGVNLIVEHPVHTVETNVMGTEAVLRAAARYRVKTCLASTSEVYGKGNRIPFSEDDDVVLGATCNSRWAYAASKMVDEFLGLAYCREKDLPVLVFRLFNTVGPRQTGQYGMVVPRFVQAALQNQPLKVYGDGEQSRCFCHVTDAVDAIVRLSENESAMGQVFNIGSTEQVTILELAKRVLCHLPESKSTIDFVPYEQAYAAGFEDMRRRLPDLTKIQHYTGWKPQHSLDQILDDVIASFKTNPN